VERYYADKLNLVTHAPAAVVYNARDPRLTEHVRRLADPSVLTAAGTPDGFDVTTQDGGGWQIRSGDVVVVEHTATRLRGTHNAVNVCLALTTLSMLGVDCAARRDDVEAALARFEPLAHRLTVIPDPSGLTFVDDSLSTAPQAAVAALEAFPHGPVAIILGGEDRGVSYDVLRDHLAGSRRPVLAIGIPDSGPRILRELAGLPTVDCRLVADIPAAVAVARRELAGTGTVLLSPAAPSYGRYADFAARAAAFVEAVRASA
jgi:UDP-N-acetylmuramoylalanine--D-glutamate ligase